MIENQPKRRNIFSRYKLEAIDVKSNLLTRSLLWMSLGLMVIIFVAWLSANSVDFINFTFKITTGYSSVFIWIINIIIMFALFYTVSPNKNFHIIIPITLYILFAIYEGMFITTLLVLTGSQNIAKDLLLYMLIPAGVFALMGILGYFGIVNFTKFIPFATFGVLGLLIMWIVMFFVFSSFLYAFYSFLAMAVFTIWIGIDLQLIFRTQQALPEYMDKKQINKISFMFGIKLFVDFLNLLIILIRFFNWR